MSRSRKRNPIYKDKGYSKYNRIFRAKNKQRLRQLLVDESTVFVLSNEAVNQYNICDYIVRDLYKFYNNENVYKAYIK